MVSGLSGPRILGEPAFAFELDALTQDEVTRPGWPVTTTRASGATCIDGHSVGANEACVSSVGLECFASGVGGRTAADVHTVSTAGWPVEAGRICVRYVPRIADSAAARILVDTRSSLNNGYQFLVTSTEQLRFFFEASELPTSSALTLVANTPTILCVDWDGTSVSFTQDGVSRGSANTTYAPTGPIRPTAAIGSSVAGTFQADGSLSLVRITEGRGGGGHVAAIGDSITEGTPYATTPYPARLQALLSDQHTVVNHGHSGWHAGQLLDLWTTTIRKTRPEYVVVLAGVNDIRQDGTASDTYAQLSALYASARADGATVVAVTLLPFGANETWTEGRQAQLDALNAMIRATDGVTVVDAYASMAEPGTPTALNAAYDYGDGLHLNDAGAAALAALVAEAIQ